MTERQRQLARALGRCTMLPGSKQKRFARDMAYRADHGEHATPQALTPAQEHYLELTAWMYRKQLGIQRSRGFDVPEPMNPKPTRTT